MEVRLPNIFKYGGYATDVVFAVYLFLMCVGGIDGSTTNDVIAFVFIINHVQPITLP